MKIIKLCFWVKAWGIFWYWYLKNTQSGCVLSDRPVESGNMHFALIMVLNDMT
jgi:hypothetical protein